MVYSSKGFLELFKQQADIVMLSKKMLNILKLKLWLVLIVVPLISSFKFKCKFTERTRHPF